MSEALTGYDLVALGGDCLQDAYVHQLRGEPIPDADSALADKLWRTSDNMLSVLISGLEGLGDLLVVASFVDDGSELGTDVVGKVGGLVGELARLIDGAMFVQDRPGPLRKPDTPGPRAHPPAPEPTLPKHTEPGPAPGFLFANSLCEFRFCHRPGAGAGRGSSIGGPPERGGPTTGC